MILTYPFRLISKDNEKIQNRNGRYFLSKKFKDWEKLVREYTTSQCKNKHENQSMLKGNLYMRITANFTNKKHCDTQNLPKGLCDALQGVIMQNDNQIKRLSIEVNENALNDTFEVVVDEI